MNPTFAAAFEHHRAGRFDQAAALYRQVLQTAPNDADALHLLGVALHQAGQHDQAVQWIEQAIAVRGNDAAFHANLGEVYFAVGKLPEAARSYQDVMRLEGASPVTHMRLGDVRQQQQRFDEAIAEYRESLNLDSQNIDVVERLARLLHQVGRTTEAIDCYRQGLVHAPGRAEWHYGMGVLCQAQGQLDEAESAYRAALARDPDAINVLVKYGGLLEQLGRLTEAHTCYQRLNTAHPEFPLGHFLCGNVYRAQGNAVGAIAKYAEAIRLQHDFAGAYSNLSMVYVDLGQADAAEQCARDGLRYAPSRGELYSNLANALVLQGRTQEALVARRRAVELLPNNAREHGNLLYDLNFVSEQHGESLFAEHLSWASKYAEPLTRVAPPPRNSPDPARRLRVGYVSPYFREHAVNFFVEPILASHDHHRFEIFCYSDTSAPDATTARLRSCVDMWRDTARLSDEQLAELVRSDSIDILVDLTGHIGGNRLLTFARKPAPVQVTYIGYQNTTGMSAIDYRLSDAHADPLEVTDRYYTEKLVRLPRSFFVYRPGEDAPAISPLPAIARGYATFGSFNLYRKVSRAALDAWLEIMSHVGGSRLLILAQRGGFAERRLRELAAARGIEPDRIEFADRLGHADYMKFVALADVAVDPFPFNGHTTTCDALWMGVPVVTLAGTSYASRFGSSAHKNLGLEEFIAASVAEYVKIAVRAASDLPELAELRQELRPRMQSSPLLDFAGFVRNLENAYREMWQTWCAKQIYRGAVDTTGSAGAGL